MKSEKEIKAKLKKLQKMEKKLIMALIDRKIPKPPFSSESQIIMLLDYICPSKIMLRWVLDMPIRKEMMGCINCDEEPKKKESPFVV